MRRAKIFTLFSILALAIWELLDAMAPKGTAFGGAAFSASLLIVATISFVDVFCNGVRKSDIRWISFLFFAFCIVFLSFYYNYGRFTHRSSYHIFVDCGTVLALFLCFLYSSRMKILDLSKSYYILICSPLIVAMFLAPVAAKLNLLPQYWWGGRYDPPHYVVISLFLSGVLFLRGSMRVAAGFLLALTIPLVLYSGTRSAFAGLAIIIGITPLIFLDLKGKLSSLFFLSLGAIGILFMTQSVDVSGIRAVSISDGLRDESLRARFNEASDIFRDTSENGDFIQLLIGHGPGATWEMYDTKAAVTRDVFEGNRVHYAHIGPVSIFYRFGLIGMILAIIPIYLVAYASILFVRIKGELSEGDKFKASFLYSSALLFSFNWLFRSSLYDFTAVLFFSMFIILISSNFKITKSDSAL